MVVGKSSPFGGHMRTETLLALCLLEETYARELARFFQRPLFGVQKALRSLEDDGLVPDDCEDERAWFGWIFDTLPTRNCGVTSNA